MTRHVPVYTRRAGVLAALLLGCPLLACQAGKQPSAPLATPTPPAGDSTVQTVPFKPILGDALPGSLSGLGVTLLAYPEQNLDEALAFSVRLENAGPETASFHNVYDVLSYQLTDAEGWAIGTRAPPSRIKTNGRIVDRSGYLRVTAIQVNGLPAVDIDAQIRENTLVMPPGSTYVYYLQIENVAPPQGKEGPIFILPGAYSLSCVVSLLSATDEEPRGAVLESGSLGITVQ